MTTLTREGSQSAAEQPVIRNRDVTMSEACVTRIALTTGGASRTRRTETMGKWLAVRPAHVPVELGRVSEGGPEPAGHLRHGRIAMALDLPIDLP